MEYLQYSIRSLIYFIFSSTVLNLIINGIPSILEECILHHHRFGSFKPYYKWNTFNTEVDGQLDKAADGSFKPYYKWNTFNTWRLMDETVWKELSFKPYYKWNTFNTRKKRILKFSILKVLNLIINGIPSIHC